MTKEYRQLVGNVAQDPTTRETKIGEVVNFGLAVRTGYDEGDVRFYRVAVFNEGLRARAKSEVYKGAKGIAVEGWIENKPYNDKDSWEIVSDKLGITEWFAATRKGEAAPAAVEPSPEYANV